MGEGWGPTLKRVLKGPIGRAEPRTYHWLPYLISGPVALRYCCLIPVPRSECLALVGWEVSMPGSHSACNKAWVTFLFPFQPCFLKDLELHVHFKVHGTGKKNLHGDGIALWYTRDRLVPGG